MAITLHTIVVYPYGETSESSREFTKEDLIPNSVALTETNVMRRVNELNRIAQLQYKTNNILYSYYVSFS